MTPALNRLAWPMIVADDHYDGRVRLLNRGEIQFARFRIHDSWTLRP